MCSIATALVGMSILPNAEFPGKVAAQAQSIPTDANLKIAFIADTGNGSGFSSVLSLIKSEGAQAVVHQGDFDYSYNAGAFFGKIDSVLGANFPYFASVGNHDDASWNDTCSDTDGCYAKFLKDRMGRIGVTPDDPDLNDQMYSAVFKGLKLVFAGQNSGSGDSVYAPYIQQQLSGDTHIWKVCSWHKNQNYMQLGTKGNEMGWNVYERCREAGAIIATGHEHTYERTKTMTDFDALTVDPNQHPKDTQGVPQNPNSLLVSQGRTFALVTGLGGNGMRNQDRCLPTTYPYGGGPGCNYIWANAYTTDQGSVHGAVFIIFNVDGNPNKARGYFKDINGKVADQFEITKSATSVFGASPPSVPTANLTPMPTPSQSPKPSKTATPTSGTQATGTAMPSPTATRNPTVQASKTPKPTNAPQSVSTSIVDADANGDGKTDAVDYRIWRAQFGLQVTGGAGMGDFNEDGVVDGVDYVLWMNAADGKKKTITRPEKPSAGTKHASQHRDDDDEGDDDDDDRDSSRKSGRETDDDRSDTPRNKPAKGDDDDEKDDD